MKKVELTLTEEQHAALAAAAKELHYDSVSALIRQSLFGFCHQMGVSTPFPNPPMKRGAKKKS